VLTFSSFIIVVLPASGAPAGATFAAAILGRFVYQCADLEYFFEI
jgi:hypothetical protein